MEARKFDFTVGDWRVDVKASCIFNDDGETHVEPKAMEVLQLLAKAQGDVVSRESIMESVWNGRFVTDYALNNVIASLRKYLCPDDKNKYIVTRPKRGYQLVSPVEFAIEPTPAPDLSQHSAQSDSKNSSLPMLHDNTGGSRLHESARSNSKIRLVAAFAALIVVVGLISSVGPIGSNEIDRNIVAKESLAVLPFKTQKDVSELSYLAMGLSNELIAQFSGSEDLLVMDQRSTKDIVSRTRDAREVSDLLSVDFVLDGNVYKESDTTYIDVVLYDELGNERWSSTFTANSDSVFTLQDDILLEVHKTMDTEPMLLTESTTYYRSSNPQAFENLLKGRALNNEATVKAYKQAIVHFQLAIEFDPNYASAYLDLATAYLLLYGTNSLSLDEANANAKPLIERAKMLAPDNPSTYAVQGIFAMYNRQFKKAIDYFSQALVLDSDLYLARANLSHLYSMQGEYELALEQSLKSLQIHPLAAVPNFQVGDIYFELGEVSKAIKQLKRCVGFVLNYDDCHLELAFIQRLISQHQDAQQTFEDMLSTRAALSDFWVILNQGFHAWWQNDLSLANRYYGQLFQEHRANFSFLSSYAWLQWQMGQKDAFMEELQALDQESTSATAHLMRSLALLAYANGDCDQMFEYYRRSDEIEAPVQYKFSHLIEGYSDALNKAACYRKAGQPQLAQSLIEGVELGVSTGDTLGQSAAGIQLIRAKLSLLKGEATDLASLREVLEQKQYPHVWMLDEDWLFQ
ncbi:winged helix-turn-helix domain-containing protein [Ningiella sp. W23]|uniref:winged helix-turn-helix domain-containing protein n=1 Tax=Ningiella sp. W23 TaxID=3023715 RepID=UPI003756CE36